MIRWRHCLLLSLLLLLLPLRIDSKDDDDEEDNRRADSEEEEEEEEEDDDDMPDKDASTPQRRTPAHLAVISKTSGVTRTTKKFPLECYVCAFKVETPLRACLDPVKYRVHTITCQSVEDRCFTTVMSKGNSYDAVVRGCRTGCVPSHDTYCCGIAKCNNQAFSMPVIQTKTASAQRSKSTKTMAPSVLFFVTILLLLQTVAKVAFF